MECRILRDERLDVLYGEADSATQKRVDEHLAVCETCREESAALVSLRQDLRSWSLPALPGTPVRALPRRLLRALPTAAAVLLAAGGAFGLAGSEIRYEDGQLSVRLGRAAPADYRQALADQEARTLQREKELQEEMRSLKTAAVAEPRSPREMLARVEQMIHDSELRQAQQVQTSLLRLDQRAEAQRRYDLARVAASLAYLDGRNGQQVARTTELMGYVLEASHNKR
jgi:5-carboxymethyl-2-hydroxymuconate isomerase